MKWLLLPVTIALTGSFVAVAYTAPSQLLGRRDFGLITGSIIALSQPAPAFAGSGSSAYAGRSPASNAERRKSYQERVAADVRDFIRLGAAISNGETDGGAWINFYITLPRKEPDAVGRIYGALLDFRGLPAGREFEGGDGLLLASSFTKPGKPPGNSPAVKSFNKLSKSFEPIEVAGKKGDAVKAKTEWENASALLSQYLADVNMPASLADPLYK
jgi:hypothetical protein